MVLGIVILAVLTMAGGAVALRAGRIFLERSAERAEGAQDAADAVDDRHRRYPWRYITLQSTRLMEATRPLELRRGHLDAERAEVRAAIDAEPEPPSLVRKLLEFACLALIPLLFLLSCYQLIPSWYTLWGNVPLSVFGGVLVAGIEVFIAFLVARVLFRGRRGEPLDGEVAVGTASAAALPPGAGAGQRGHRGGRTTARRVLEAADSRPGSLKILLTSGMALVAAGLLIWGQYEWAPLHDTINIGNQLTVATDKYALDQANDPGQAGLLTSDREAIDTINTRLSAARARDQALAVVVPLGEDVAALPALGALGYAAEDLRRMRRRRRRASLGRRINALDLRIARVRNAMTLQTQRRLDLLGLDPRIATAPVPPLIAPQPPLSSSLAPGTPADPAHPVIPGQVLSPGQPGDPGPGTAPARPGPGQPGQLGGAAAPANPPGAEPDGDGVTAEDLFPRTITDPGAGTAATGADADADEDDRRWTDPL